MAVPQDRAETRAEPSTLGVVPEMAGHTEPSAAASEAALVESEGEVTPRRMTPAELAEGEC